MRDLGVAPLDGVLGPLDGLGHHLGLDGDVVGKGPAHHPVHGAGGEQAHQVVLQGQEEPALTRVALAPRPAPQLVVDAPALVALAAQHVETAECTDLVALGRADLLELGPDLVELRRPLLGGEVDPPAGRLPGGQPLGIAAQDDVDASAGHVGGHGHATHPAGLGHDLRLPEVLLGVEHLVGDALLLQQPRQVLGLGHRGRAHQHRLAPCRGAR